MSDDSKCWIDRINRRMESEERGKRKVRERERRPGQKI